MQTKTNFTTVDEYIRTFPPDVQRILQKLRETIAKAAPEAGEKISYQIPTFTYKGNLVHFAGYEHHIGFYPGSAAVEAFKKELSNYKTSKGTVQFPLDEPLPLPLVSKIVKFSVKKNQQRGSR